MHDSILKSSWLHKQTKNAEDNSKHHGGKIKLNDKTIYNITKIAELF